MGGEKPTVLVVEDDPSLRLLCRVNLEVEGFTVLEADRLAPARKHLAADSVAAVLLDMHLGDEDGRDLLRELREKWPAVGVALLTGSAEVDPESRSLATAVLAKPFALEDLSATVRKLVEPPAA